MEKVVKVDPVGLMPTPAGCAVFLSDGQKVIMFYVDPSIGDSINVGMGNDIAQRPLTHDLFASYISAMGGKFLRTLIVKYDKEVYYARVFIETSNELMQKKIVELDARTSDSIAMAVRAGAPIYFLREVWDQSKDVSDLLKQMSEEQEM